MVQCSCGFNFISMTIGELCAAVPTNPPEDASVHTHVLGLPCATP